MTEPIRVLIADDRSLFRAGLASILQAETGMKVVGQASDSLELIDMARKLKPQVILTDLRLNGCDFLDSVPIIKQSLPTATTVILTDSEQEEDVFRALLCGVQGYLLKSCSRAELVRAVRKAAAGEVILSEPIAATLVKELRDKARAPRLSEREQDVVTLLGEGLANREIAKRLVVSESTVRTHIYHLQEKLGLKSRAEITIWASRRSPGFAGTAERLKVLETHSQYTGKRGLLSLLGVEAPAPTQGTAQRGQAPENEPAAGTAIASERKLTTVLSVELSLFGDAAKAVQPEKAEELIHECLDLVASEILTYGGTLAWFTGGGVMSFFGIPLSLEHAPQRALYAALAIQERMKARSEQPNTRDIQVNTRMGVNTGLVQVDTYLDGLTSKNIPVGDTTEVASRIRDMGELNTVIVSENTYRLTRYLFSFDQLSEARINEQEQANIYRLTGLGPAKTKLQAVALRGLTKFVARQRELMTLEEVSLKAGAGSGQLVGIVGDAGVGKSRLLLEFRQRLSSEEFTYLEGSCIHYGEYTPYLAFLQALRSYFDIGQTESESSSRAKLEAKTQGLGGNALLALPPLCDIMCLRIEDEGYTRLEPAQKRVRIFDAVRDILLMESRSKSVVLVIEDCHWMDKTSEELLSYLVDLLADNRIMLILVYRPEYRNRWGNRSFYTQITLNELSPTMSVELAQSILDDGTAARELQELVIDTAGGNPLFVEELVYNLRESGAMRKKDGEYVLAMSPSEVKVPASIQGVIAARIDQLDSDTKYAMQVASVIGRDFHYKILESAAQMKGDLKACLLRLQQQELVYQRSWTLQPEYAFKHALTQTVAYNSLLSKRRKEMHEKIGQAIEELYGERLEEFYETLAHHYSRSDNSQKAYHYLRLSGDKASQNYSMREAFRFYRDAITILGKEPENKDNKKRRIEVLLSITGPMVSLGFPEDSLQILREGEKLARELNDERSLADLYTSISIYYSLQGNPVHGIKYCENCVEEALKIQDVGLAAPIGMVLCAFYFLSGDLLKMVEASLKVLALIEKTQKETEFFGTPFNTYSGLHAHCGHAMAMLGRFGEGEALCEKALRSALELNSVSSIGWAEVNYSYLYMHRGDGKNTVEHAEKAISYFDRAQLLTTTGVARTVLGMGYYLQENLGPARAYMEQGIKIHNDTGMPSLLSLQYYFLGAVHLNSGDLANAQSCAERALYLSQTNREKYFEGRSWVLLGKVEGRVNPSQGDKAEEFILRGISILDQLKTRPACAEGYLCLGELYADAGEGSKAHEYLRRAQTMFRDMGMDYWLLKTQASLRKLE